MFRGAERGGYNRGMEAKQPRIAVFPGAFDPTTSGHIDIIERACKLFDELIVAVGDNPAKKSLFTHKQRCDMLAELVADIPNVRVGSFTGLTVNYAKDVGAVTILRGIRDATDLQFEFQLALTNRAAAGVETVFIMPRSDFAFTSSTLIKQIAAMGGDVSAFVPPLVARRLAAVGATGDAIDHLQGE